MLPLKLYRNFGMYYHHSSLFSATAGNGDLSTDNWENLFIILYIINLIDPARTIKKEFE